MAKNFSATEMMIKQQNAIVRILEEAGEVAEAHSTSETSYFSEFLSASATASKRFSIVNEIKALPLEARVVYTVNVFSGKTFCARYTFIRYNSAIEYLEEVNALGFTSTIDSMFVTEAEYTMLCKQDFNAEVM
jgi:hypothetical protein